MDVAVLLDNRVGLENGKIRHSRSEGLAPDDQAKLRGLYSDFALVDLRLDEVSKIVDDLTVPPFRGRHDADFAVDDFFDGIANLGQTKPLFVGDRLRIGEACHAAFLLHLFYLVNRVGSLESQEDAQAIRDLLHRVLRNTAAQTLESLPGHRSNVLTLDEALGD